jgi:hypothetical protein
MNSKILFSTIFTSIFLLFTEITFAQDGSDSSSVQNYEPGLAFTYLKNMEGNRVLICDIKVKKDKQFLPIENAEIHFFAGFNSEITLGSAKSDNKGRAKFEIKPDVNVAINDTGAFKIAAEYKAGPNSEGAREELVIVDMSLEMTLEEVDSVRTVTIKATRFGKNKEVVPLGNMEINILVKRLYNDLIVGKAFLDAESGQGSVEFPIIPGDSVGNVTVIARIEGNEIFGTVEKKEVKKWGTPVEYRYNRIGPALWSEHAPTWMTITLYIFLAGVWYHLILVFRRMFKVKKLGKEMNKNSNP